MSRRDPSGVRLWQDLNGSRGAPVRIGRVPGTVPRTWLERREVQRTHSVLSRLSQTRLVTWRA